MIAYTAVAAAAAPSRFLAEGHDNLFMAPGPGCTMLQWSEARTKLMVRRDGLGSAVSALLIHSHSSHTSLFTHHYSKVPSGLSRATNEDFDAAPSGAVMTPHDGSASIHGDEVTAILADELGNALWTGECVDR